jgi:hypothetical protein
VIVLSNEGKSMRLINLQRIATLFLFAVLSLADAFARNGDGKAAIRSAPSAFGDGLGQARSMQAKVSDSIYTSPIGLPTNKYAPISAC